MKFVTKGPETVTNGWPLAGSAHAPRPRRILKRPVLELTDVVE